MKKIIIAALMLICAMPTMKTQAATEDNITIAAYVPQEANLTAKEAEAVTSMLNRLMTAYGCAGAGFDNRFIVVPSIREARSEVVGLDSKAVVELDVDLFMGDGVNGTMFSSTSFTVKGIGKTMEQARIAALRKAPARNAQMQEFVNVGKERIVNYYEEQGPAIIKSAQAMAQRHEYDNAVSTLFAIPSMCSHYAQAQKLAGEYGLKYATAQNDDAIRKAQNAWAADSSEAGAAEAAEALNSISNPTAAQKAEMDRLRKAIDAKFTQRENREHQARMAAEKNRHSERMSQISANASTEKARYAAAASIAKSYAASRPRVVYHVHSWY